MMPAAMPGREGNRIAEKVSILADSFKRFFRFDRPAVGYSGLHGPHQSCICPAA